MEHVSERTLHGAGRLIQKVKKSTNQSRIKNKNMLPPHQKWPYIKQSQVFNFFSKLSTFRSQFAGQILNSDPASSYFPFNTPTCNLVRTYHHSPRSKNVNFPKLAQNNVGFFVLPNTTIYRAILQWRENSKKSKKENHQNLIPDMMGAFLDGHPTPSASKTQKIQHCFEQVSGN